MPAGAYHHPQLHEIGGAADTGRTDCVRLEQLVYGARVRESRRYDCSETSTFQLYQTSLEILEAAQLRSIRVQLSRGVWRLSSGSSSYSVNSPISFLVFSRKRLIIITCFGRVAMKL